MVYLFFFGFICLLMVEVIVLLFIVLLIVIYLFGLLLGERVWLCLVFVLLIGFVGVGVIVCMCVVSVFYDV